MPARARRSSLFLAVVAGLLAVGQGRSLAQEGEPGAGLVVWHGPEGCADGGALEDEVARILGGPPGVGPVGHLTVIAVEGGFAATLALDGQRPRGLEAGACEGLVRAVALIVALHLDPDALGFGASSPEPAPVPAPEPWLSELDASRVDASRAQPPEPVRSLDSPWPPPTVTAEPPARFVGAVGLALDVGAMPGAAPGAWLGAAARLSWIEIGLEGRFHPEQRAALAPRPEVGAEVTLLAGRVRVGAGLALVRTSLVEVELVPLVALELGAVSARGVGLMSPLAGSALWWAAQVGVEGRVFFLEHVGIVLRAELEVPLRRSSFLVEGYDTPVFRAADAGLVTLVGLALRTR